METDELRLEAQDLNQQGAILLRTGNHEAAKAKFDKAIELDPMLMDSYKNYGELVNALGEATVSSAEAFSSVDEQLRDGFKSAQ